MSFDPFTREHGFCVGSVPFSGEHSYAGESILPVFRSENGVVSLVMCTREHVPLTHVIGEGYCSSIKGSDELTQRKENGRSDVSRSGASIAFPCSVQQTPGVIRAGALVQASGGVEAEYWDPYIRNTDVVGSKYCVSNLGGRSADDVTGVKGGRRLGSRTVSKELVTVGCSEARGHNEQAPTARISGCFAGVAGPHGPCKGRDLSLNPHEYSQMVPTSKTASGIGMLTVSAGYSGLVKAGSEHVFLDPIVDNNVCRLVGLPDGVKISATMLSGKHGKQPAMGNGAVGSSRDCGYEPLLSETSRFEDVVKGKSTEAYGCDFGGLQVRSSEQSLDSIFLIYELGRGGEERVWDFKRHSNRGWE